MESSSNETKNEEPYLSNQDPLTSLKPIQQQTINFDNFLEKLQYLWYTDPGVEWQEYKTLARQIISFI